MENPLLRVTCLSVSYQIEDHAFQALNQISLSLNEREIVGLKGGSGEGKTTLFKAILGLLPEEAMITSGTIMFQNMDITQSHYEDYEAYEQVILPLRGKEITAVFQNVKTSFDPLLTIYQEIEEVVQNHQELSFFQRRKYIYELLEKVGFDNPKRIARMNREILSDGELQRILFAIAIANHPRLLILDEPFSFQDDSHIQLLISRIKELQEEGTTIFIAHHDDEILEQLCNRILRIEEGTLTENGGTV